MKKEEEIINCFEKFNRKSGVKKSCIKVNENEFSNIALLKRQAESIENGENNPFRWQSIVGGTKSTPSTVTRRPQTQEIKGIHLLCLQDIVPQNRKEHVLKAFQDSFDRGHSFYPSTAHSQRKDRCLSTSKKYSLQKSATASKGATIAFLQKQEEEFEKKKQVVFPFSKYFIANKTKRRMSQCTTSYVSGRAMKKHSLLCEFTKTL